jgi:hypothetical protein
MKRDDDWPEEKPCKLKNMVNPGQELAEKEGMRERREREVKMRSRINNFRQ